MKNYKPSQMPAGTVIDDVVHGTWMKDSSYAWHSLMSREWIFDHGMSSESSAAYSSALVNVRTEAANDYFQNFEVKSFPVEMVTYMAQQYSKIIEADLNEFCVEQAMKHCMDDDDICPWPNGGVLMGVDGCC